MCSLRYLIDPENVKECCQLLEETLVSKIVCTSTEWSLLASPEICLALAVPRPQISYSAKKYQLGGLVTQITILASSYVVGV